MRKLWERNPNPAGRTRRDDCRAIKFEALEDRRLLTATAQQSPHSYADWIPEAVLKAQDFLSSNPTLTGDVESWFAEEDAAEAASGIKVTLVEVHLPQDAIPPNMSIELVEEMMEELIEDRTPVQDVVEVIFNNVPNSEIDARLALRTYATGAAQTLSTVRVAAADVDLAQTAVAADEVPVDNDEAISDPTIAVEEAEQVEELPVDVDAPADSNEADAAAFKKPVAEHNDDAGNDSSQSLAPQDEARLLLLPAPGERPNFLTHLRADLQAVDASIDAMLDDLQVLRRDIAQWLEEPPVTFWAKVGIGGAAMLAAWREVRRWRERRDQPDEEAVDWLFLHSLDHEGNAP